MQKILKKIKYFCQARFDILFFWLFLAASTLSVRKVLYYFPLQGSFNEYSGTYIYLSDIFLLLTFISFILYNNKLILSTIITSASNLYNFCKLFHVEQFTKNAISKLHCSTWNNKKTIEIVPRGTISIVDKNYLTIFTLFIAIFSFFSVRWADSTTVAIFRSIKLSEFVLLYFYTRYIIAHRTTHSLESGTLNKSNKLFHVEQFEIKNNLCGQGLYKNILCQEENCSTWNNLNVSFLITICVGVIQSIIGITQFIIQHSLGLFWLKESLISPNIPGVAKVILHHTVLIRAYGLFPHPNIFGGYLVFSIIATCYLIRLFHVEQSNKIACKTKFAIGRSSELSACKGELSNIVPRGTILLQSALAIQMVALLLTFSKSAILGLFVGFIYIFMNKCFIDSNATITEKIKYVVELFHVEQFKRKALLICAILMMLFILIKPDIYSLFIKSLLERGFYLNISLKTFLSNPFLGVGAGQFIFQLLKVPGIQGWQFQPVHNVFLLITNDYGVFILLGFILFLSKLFTQNNCSTWNNQAGEGLFLYLKAILLAFVFIMMFDHYFWDIQQGSILLWMIFALVSV